MQETWTPSKWSQLIVNFSFSILYAFYPLWFKDSNSYRCTSSLGTLLISLILFLNFYYLFQSKLCLRLWIIDINLIALMFQLPIISHISFFSALKCWDQFVHLLNFRVLICWYPNLWALFQEASPVAVKHVFLQPPRMWPRVSPLDPCKHGNIIDTGLKDQGT